MKLTEESGGWRLALSQGFVQLIQIDFRLGLFLGDAPDMAKLYIAEDFLLKNQGREDTINPEDSCSLAPLLAFFNAKVAGIDIRTTGHLRLEFEAGSSLEVNPNELYEAWELNSSIGVMMICSPGGSVSLFRNSQTSHVNKT